jgi:hypothetical protein
MNRIIIVALALFVLQACNPQSRGFNLPPGDAENGKSTSLTIAVVIYCDMNYCSVYNVCVRGSQFRTGLPSIEIPTHCGILPVKT